MTVQLTAESYAAFHLAVQRRLMRKADSPWGAAIAGIYALTVMSGSKLIFDDLAIGAGIAAHGLVFYFAMLFEMRRRYNRALSDLGRVFYGEWTYEIDRDCLRIGSPLFTKSFRFEAFASAYVADGIGCMMLGALTGFHLPASGGNHAEVGAFIAEMERRIHSSGGQRGSSA